MYADVVLNHKAGADESQRFLAVEVDQNDRTRAVTDPYEIEGWTRFTFPGRGDTYSSFKWSWEHFNGTDYNQENGKNAIYLILGDNKKWSVGVAREFGNYDYLMFANIDYGHPEVQEEAKRWLKWFVRETGVDGVRLDAIKHINDWFIRDLLFMTQQEFGDEFYTVGEYWEQDLELVKKYLKEVDYRTDLFDVGLKHRIYEASLKGRDFDLRTILNGSLVQHRSESAVTFVDNHDSQPGQPLQSYVEPWFKPMGYALILLRREGYPCVFYGDYYGISGPNPLSPQREMLDKLLHLRKEHAYGEQVDYFQDANRVGWVRLGTEEHPAGCAVVISNGEGGEIAMEVGSLHAGEVWSDYTGNQEARVSIDEKGKGVFPVNGGSLSVFIRES